MSGNDDELRTLSRPKVARAALGEPSFALLVTEGPDVGTRFDLEQSLAARVLIGQGPVCDVRLSDRQVSRRHAALERATEGLRLTDLGSTNGTFAQGMRVFDVLLVGGETIRLGDTSIAVERVQSAAAHSLPSRASFGRVLGASAVMRRLYALCERVAHSEVALLIEGETGTGKEVLAEAIHEHGPRAQKPFVVFDCTAVPATLIESALFGHERGAFTGATEQRRGVFEEAQGGTLLLDEIGDLELALQAKLLRAIERKEIKRVGGDKWIKVDVRVLAATRRNLDQEIQEGRFRDDLFYRLAVARVELPPLRRRAGDITLLARHFWSELGGTGAIDEPWLQHLESDPWPGNVRELYNAVARRVALGELSAELGCEQIGQGAEESFDAILAQDLPLPRARERALELFLKRYVERVLTKHGGNVARAARASGVARRYFQLVKARSGG